MRKYYCTLLSGSLPDWFLPSTLQTKHENKNPAVIAIHANRIKWKTCFSFQPVMFSFQVFVIVFPVLPMYPPDNTRPWAKKSLPWRTRYHICEHSDWLWLRHWMKSSSFSKHRDYCFSRLSKPSSWICHQFFCYFDILNNTCSRFLRVFFIPLGISRLKMRQQNALSILHCNSWGENASNKTQNVDCKRKSMISRFVYPCITSQLISQDDMNVLCVAIYSDTFCFAQSVSRNLFVILSYSKH